MWTKANAVELYRALCSLPGDHRVVYYLSALIHGLYIVQPRQRTMHSSSQWSGVLAEGALAGMKHLAERQSSWFCCHLPKRVHRHPRSTVTTGQPARFPTHISVGTAEEEM